MVRLDFETRSKADLKTVGANLYSKHSSTEALCLSFQIDDGPLLTWHKFTGQTKCPGLLVNALKDGHLFRAHNALFEFNIWNNVCVPKYGWPPLPFDQYSCSAAEAAAMGLPRALDKLGEALKCDIVKDQEGKRVMLKMSQPKRASKKDYFNEWHEDPEDINTLLKYNRDDVLAEAAANELMDPLSPFEQRVWALDQEMNLRGLLIDRRAVDAALFLIEQYESKLLKKLERETHGLVTSVGQNKRIIEFLAANEVYTESLAAPFVTELLTKDMPPRARRVLEIKQLLSKASAKKFQAMSDRMDPKDDRVRDILIYSGAATGRWAGTGLQIQNLIKGIFQSPEEINKCIDLIYEKDLELLELCYTRPLDAISSCLRGMIIAPEGKVLRAFDYNAIEARVLFWLAGCELGIKEFRDKLDPYKGMAADVYGIDKSEVDKKQRQLGKTIVLGCGYQMGAKKFKVVCESQKIDISEELALKAVNGYRTRYKEVPIFWRQLNDAFIAAVRTKEVQRVGLLLMKIEGRFLKVRLPSGRFLYYCDPALREISTPYGDRTAFHYWYSDALTKQWTEGAVFGGLLAENVVQATSRDLLVDAMLNLKAAGYTPLFSVHDEVITEDLESFGSLAEIEKIMLTTPKWAEGLPVAVEGWQSTRYQK